MLGMLATFLPWASIPLIGTVNGTVGDGWITLALFVPAAIAALLGDRSRAMGIGATTTISVLSGVAGFIGAWKIVDLKVLMAEAPDDNPFAEAMASAVSVGVGLYALIIAGLTVVISAFALRR